MAATTIKTVAFLIKCLKVDIPIYKIYSGVTVRIPRVSLYRASLIEHLTAVSEGTLHIPYTKEAADAIIVAANELAKRKEQEAADREAFVTFQKGVINTSPAPEKDMAEPGYTPKEGPASEGTPDENTVSAPSP